MSEGSVPLFTVSTTQYRGLVSGDHRDSDTGRNSRTCMPGLTETESHVRRFVVLSVAPDVSGVVTIVRA